MQPSFDLRIRSMIKALTEAVAPGVDPLNKMAVEQLNITIASLALLKDQVEYVQWFEFVETNEMLALAERVAAILGAAATDLIAGAREAANAALRRDVTLSAAQDGNIRLRGWLSELLDLSAGHAEAASVRRVFLDACETQVGRERAFVAGTRFDVFPDNLASIERALTVARN